MVLAIDRTWNISIFDILLTKTTFLVQDMSPISHSNQVIGQPVVLQVLQNSEFDGI